MKRRVFAAYADLLNLMPARAGITIEFLRRHGRLPDLRGGETFSEKIQRRKLYGDVAAYARLADKIAVKPFVRSTLGTDWVTPSLWEGTELPERPDPAWGSRFIVKSAFGCKQNCIVRDVSSVHWDKVRALCRRWRDRGEPIHVGERFYRLIPGRLLVEPLIADSLLDYKFYVFGGSVEYIHVHRDRFVARRSAFYDVDWNKQAFNVSLEVDELDVPRPVHLERMITAAESLAAGFDFVRVDLYDTSAGPLFGEMTFTPGSGFGRFRPLEADLHLGRLWKMDVRSSGQDFLPAPLA